MSYTMNEQYSTKMSSSKHYDLKRYKIHWNSERLMSAEFMGRTYSVPTDLHWNASVAKICT